MGKEVVNGGLEPVVVGADILWRVYAGSALTRHTAPPDEALLPDDLCRDLCQRAAQVDAAAFEMSIPPMWRDWWQSLGPPHALTPERVAVWRGCRAMWVRFGAGW